MIKIDLHTYANETINFLQLKCSRLQNVVRLLLNYYVKKQNIYKLKDYADISLVKTVFNGLESLPYWYPKIREIVPAELKKTGPTLD